VLFGVRWFDAPSGALNESIDCQSPKPAARHPLKLSMGSFNPGFPEPTEYNPAFAGYVGKARAVSDPIQKLTDQMQVLLALLGPLDANQQQFRYAPGKWSIQEVLGHIIDTERIFAYRTLRVARADTTPLASFDQDPYVAASQVERCEWSSLLEEFEHVRRASILLLRHLPPAAWTRTGTASNAPISVRALVYVMIGHVEHHLDILRERYL
jgi:DinB superfamily